MTAPVTQDAPVDTGDDDPDHIVCGSRDVTWCGVDASGMPLLTHPPALDQFCRMCVLAFEMYEPHAPCPVCGTHACLL